MADYEVVKFSYGNHRFKIGEFCGLYIMKSDGTYDYTSYQSLIEALNPNYLWIHLQDDDYQGDYYSVAYDVENDNWLFIEGSFGSCSGCDELEGVSCIEDARDILGRLSRPLSIGNKEAALKYLEGTLNNAYYKDTVKDVINTIKNY